MEQICGIYKITNLVNGKCYIGQSVNISSRWKQHTQSLNKIKNPDEENPLRRAFLKYGLLDQISQPGIYGNFKFEVLLECPKEELTEKEYAKISELQPEYNRMMCPPSEDRIWPKKQTTEKCCYVQYHNFEKIGHLPFEGFTKDDWQNKSGYITTIKRDALNLKGEKVYLILGIKQNGRKQKDYFLWEYLLIEEVDVVDTGVRKKYGVRGTHYICKKPLRLNDLPGFSHFAKNTMGSFAYGFQNIINDPFHEIIENESNFIAAKDCGMTGIEWIANFEDELEDESLWMTIRDDDDKPHWKFFEVIDENESQAWVKLRALDVLGYYPDFFEQQLDSFLKKNPNVIRFFVEFQENLKEIIIDFPQINFTILCGHYHESWNDYLREILELKNTHLMGPNDSSICPIQHLQNNDICIAAYNRNAASCWPSFRSDETSREGWSNIQTILDEKKVGKRIYNIVNLTRNGCKEAYLWNYIDVKEVQEDENFRTFWGPVFLCKQPILLDSKLFEKEENLVKKISNPDLYTPLIEIKDEAAWLHSFEESRSFEDQWRETILDKKGNAIFKE